LADVAVDDHRAILADAGQEHLDLGRGRVLRFVKQHERILPGASAHHLEGRHFNVALLQRDIVGGGAHSRLDRLDHRRGPGRELVFQRTGEEAERAPAGHVRAGQDDLGDIAGAVEVGGVGGRDPGFARAGGAEHDHLGAGLKGVEIVGLSRVERSYGRRDAFGSVLGLVERYDLSGIGETAVATPGFLDALAQWRYPLHLGWTLALGWARKIPRAAPTRVEVSVGEGERRAGTRKRAAGFLGSRLFALAPWPIEEFSPAERMSLKLLILATVLFLFGLPDSLARNMPMKNGKRPRGSFCVWPTT
jgi:hypothetical protein